MKLRTRLRSDGTLSDEPIFFYPADPETGKPFEPGDDGRPSVGVRLRYIGVEELRGLAAQYTKRSVDPDTKGWVEVPNHAAFADAVCLAAIQDWWGFETADGQPVPCTNQTKLFVFDLSARREIQYLATRMCERIA
jgi:hypothetical protein